jgi:hypothetical protein
VVFDGIRQAARAGDDKAYTRRGVDVWYRRNGGSSLALLGAAMA